MGLVVPWKNPQFFNFVNFCCQNLMQLASCSKFQYFIGIWNYDEALPAISKPVTQTPPVPERRRSGDVWLISLASLTSAENFPTVDHIAENTICGCNIGNPWLLQHDDTTLCGIILQLCIQ